MLSINSTHCTHLKSNAFENGQLMSFRDPYLYGSFRHWRCGGEGDTHLCPRGPSVSDNGGHTLSPQGLTHTLREPEQPAPNHPGDRSMHTFPNSPKSSRNTME